MKKILLSFLLLFSILINQELIFAVEVDNSNKNEETLEIEFIVNQLLKERSKLWNEMFSMDSDVEKIYKDLKEIVTEPLLTYDIEAFKKIKKDPTNMDKILKVTVLKIKKANVNESRINLEADIEWLMESLESNYKEVVSYKIELVKIKNKWKIKDYIVK